MSNSPVLVVGPSWVGDMVMAQSLFKALKARSPAAIIDVLAPAWSLPLLDRMPEVNQGITMPFGHGDLGLAARWQLGKSLRGRYQQAFLLPNSWKSALAPFAARIPQRIGWTGESRYGLLNDIRKLDKQLLTKTVQRFVALADDASVNRVPDILPPRLVIGMADVAAAATKLHVDISGRNKILGLCPGAEFGPAKCWPPGHYAQLATRYVNKGWAVWLFGSEKDTVICTQIKQAVGPACVDLSGRTSLAEAVDLMSAVDAVVSNDSGLMHVAAALEKPLVAVYGSTDPEFTPPLNQTHRIARLELDCSPCFQRECPLGHTDCLNKLTVDDVDVSLRELVH